ncbi:hypothetical protein ACSAZK_14830 [Methanosarcina sp. Mfa9]|uniref:hypothetical protein n=1 Tax=Methanosarcina sp. Mfa9 TaxID=3439063 RepID=UPI003F839E5D
MEFFDVLLKTVASLVGLPLFLGGFFGFWFGIYVIFGEQNIVEGILIVVGSILALTIGTILGKFARGDYD